MTNVLNFLNIWRKWAAAHKKNTLVCHYGEQRTRVSHLAFKNKWAIITKGSLFPPQAEHKLRRLRRKLSAAPREGQLNAFRNKKKKETKTKSLNNRDVLDLHGDRRGDSPGITSQMGTSRVCSKLAKLHSSFPSNTPSQSPIGLSWKSWRHENLVKLSFAPHHCDAAVGATSATLPCRFRCSARSSILLHKLKK